MENTWKMVRDGKTPRLSWLMSSHFIQHIQPWTQRVAPRTCGEQNRNGSRRNWRARQPIGRSFLALSAAADQGHVSNFWCLNTGNNQAAGQKSAWQWTCLEIELRLPPISSAGIRCFLGSFSCNILIRLIQLKCKESHGFWWILTDFAYVRWVMDPLKSFNLISFHLIWSGVVLIELALSSHLQILQPRRLALNLWRPAGTRSCTRILDWTCW